MSGKILYDENSERNMITLILIFRNLALNLKCFFIQNKANIAINTENVDLDRRCDKLLNRISFLKYT